MCVKNIELDKDDLDEDIGLYWSNLSAFDQKLWYACETYKHNVLKIHTLKKESFN